MRKMQCEIRYPITCYLFSSFGDPSTPLIFGCTPIPINTWIFQVSKSWELNVEQAVPCMASFPQFKQNDFHLSSNIIRFSAKTISISTAHRWNPRTSNFPALFLLMNFQVQTLSISGGTFNDVTQVWAPVLARCWYRWSLGLVSCTRQPLPALRITLVLTTPPQSVHVGLARKS